MGVKLNVQEYQINKERRFRHYYNRLKSIAVSRFEYLNMPPEIDIRFLEMTLFEMGFAVFYRDKFADLYVALTCMYGGELDVYNRPSIRTAYAANGYQYQLDYRDSVMIWNNYLRNPDANEIRYFASRLAQAEAVVDINMFSSRRPIALLVPEDMRLTYKNLMKQYADDDYIIYGTNALNIDDNIKPMTLTPPNSFIADKANDIKNQIWNEALTYLGIPNTIVQKKERMLSDEVNRMQGGIMASAGTHLAMREECVDMINRMFGLNIKIRMRFQGGEREVSLNNKNVSRETFMREGEVNE